jgi:hypothetical protein
MGIGFPHDPLIADCELRMKKGVWSVEWGMGAKVISQLPTPHSLLHPQSLPNPVSLV